MEIMTIALASKEITELISIFLGMGSTTLFSEIYKDKNKLISNLCTVLTHLIGISYCTVKTMTLIKYVLIMCCLL